MKKTIVFSLSVVLLLLFMSLIQVRKEITIFLAGDSTVADKPYRNGNPEKGWGQVFPLYFKAGINIENHAVNGRSTKSFIDEGRWDSLIYRVKSGDYVIIEFGHNDAKSEDPKRFAHAETNYSENLRRFIGDVKIRNGIPVLVTPIVRRRFNEDGRFYDTHGTYPDAVRKVAIENGVILMDLHKLSQQLVERLGFEKSKSLYLHVDTSEYPHLEKPVVDDTHLSAYGAFRICDLVVSEIKEKIPALTKYLKN